MKIYIFADMEGCSGIAGSAYINGPLADLGRELMLQDVNACAAGCFKAGATEVLLRDGHGGGGNIAMAQLDPRVEMISGDTPRSRFADLGGSAGLILLGYHAMAGTEAAVLEHTYSSTGIQNLWLNGRKAGEFAVDAAIAAEHGVPTLLATGDDKLCAEAVAWLPEVFTCQVKTSYSSQGARLIPLAKAHALIEEKTIEAIRSTGRIPFLALNYPVTLRQEFVERRRCPENHAYRYLDGRTIELTGDSLEKLFLFNA